MLNHATWNPLAQLGHPVSVAGPTHVVAYREVEEGRPASTSAPQLSGSRPVKSRFVVCQLPLKLTSQKVPVDKPNPKIGVGESCLPAPLRTTLRTTLRPAPLTSPRL